MPCHLLCVVRAVDVANSPAPASPSQKAQVLFRGATLIDGTRRPARAATDVLVTGERIEAVFPDAELTSQLRKTVRVVELDGRFLMPGPDACRCLKAHRGRVFPVSVSWPIRCLASDRPMPYSLASTSDEVGKRCAGS